MQRKPSGKISFEVSLSFFSHENYIEIYDYNDYSELPKETEPSPSDSSESKAHNELGSEPNCLFIVEFLSFPTTRCNCEFYC